MMITQHKYVILGGGTTAGYAVKELIKQKADPQNIAIISAEDTVPVDRPPLSKGFLKSEMQENETYIENDRFYEDKGISLYLGIRATNFNQEEKRIRITDEEAIQYDYLLIATGASPIQLEIPGSGLENIFYLRNIADAIAIKEKAQQAKSAVVIGGSYISTEVAASLKSLGLDVTIVFPEHYLLERFSVPEMGVFFNQLFKDNGVTLVNQQMVSEIIGNDKAEKVKLSSGEVISTDLVVAGIGVKPNTDLFENSGLEIDDGILVNEFCETNLPDVFAAGDVARFPDLVYGGTRRVEHWENAFEMGKNAAKSMIGYKEPYRFLPFFFSDIFDFSYEYFGDPSNANQHVIHGDINKGNFSVFWFKDAIMDAAFLSADRPEVEREKVKEWIMKKTHLNTEVMEHSEVPFQEASV
jgi:3-phenylpropionate/trans-cinnamate dioxygenase ferredoxin reductase component